MKTGLLMVLSGNADDKLVSAFGQVFRALGQGLRVCVLEFKGESWLSRSHFLQQFKDLLTLHTLENDTEPKTGSPKPDPKAAQKAWQFAKEKISSRTFEMVVLSEFIYLIAHKAIDEHEVVDFLSNRPRSVHVIITGADPPQMIVDAADLVTAIDDVTLKT